LDLGFNEWEFKLIHFRLQDTVRRYRTIMLFLIVMILIPISKASAVDWALSMEFSVSDANSDTGKSKINLVAGLDATANDGIDNQWDVPTFYNGGPVQAYFNTPNGPFWIDFRSTQSSGPTNWVIDLNADLNPVLLRWRTLGGSQCGNHSVTLSDGQGNQIIDPLHPKASGSANLSSPNNMTLTVDTSGAGGIPSAPSGLISPLQGQHGGLLVWTAVDEAGLGYNLYRSTTQGRDYTKLNSDPIRMSAYFDRNLSVGTSYYYIVRSVSASGCESTASSEAALTTEGP